MTDALAMDELESVASKGEGLTVVIPAYNEGAAIRTVLGDLMPVARREGWQIVVVDDGSQDDTAEIVTSLADDDTLRLLRHRTNRGYGAALKTGILNAESALVATLDADGQHRTEDLLNLTRLMEQYDMLVGRRVSLLHSPLWRMPGKWLLQGLAIYLSRRSIPDLNSGLRILRREVVRKYMHLCPDGFSFSTTITLVLVNRGYDVGFHPIEVRGRSGKSQVKIATGFETLLLILRLSMLLDPLRIFIPVSFLSMAAGLIWAVPFLLLGRGLSVGAMVFLVNGALTFLIGLLSDQVASLRKEKYE